MTIKSYILFFPTSKKQEKDHSDTKEKETIWI